VEPRYPGTYRFGIRGISAIFPVPVNSSRAFTSRLTAVTEFQLREDLNSTACVQTENLDDQACCKVLKNESGATAIEYGLIAAGIALAIIAAVNGLGTTLNTKFSDIGSSIK
jgi:pilus assembly protein Flp/PilA